MFTVIKLINVHYRDENHRPVKVIFKTTIEGVEEFDKRYYVAIEGEEEREVTKDEGNAEYKYLREKHPDAKVIVIIDANYEAVTHIRVADHFEVYVGYDRICACDDMKEVREVEEKLKEKLR